MSTTELNSLAGVCLPCLSGRFCLFLSQQAHATSSFTTRVRHRQATSLLRFSRQAQANPHASWALRSCLQQPPARLTGPY